MRKEEWGWGGKKTNKDFDNEDDGGEVGGNNIK